jgi:hypothetical protein
VGRYVLPTKVRAYSYSINGPVALYASLVQKKERVITRLERVMDSRALLFSGHSLTTKKTPYTKPMVNHAHHGSCHHPT